MTTFQLQTPRPSTAASQGAGMLFSLSVSLQRESVRRRPAYLSRHAFVAGRTVAPPGAQPSHRPPVQVEDSPLLAAAHNVHLQAQLSLLEGSLQPLLQPRGPWHTKVSIPRRGAPRSPSSEARH